ncbi:MAG: ATP-binding protein, partial [Acidobacteriaceae bacterium]
MRRRSKRGPNTSESTGKIGQELPQNQPAPLQPSYHGGKAPPPADREEAPESETVARAPEPSAKVAADPVGKLAAAAAAEPVGKVVLET